jgi:hypothetical protein
MSFEFEIEIEQEDDGRWIAEMPALLESWFTGSRNKKRFVLCRRLHCTSWQTA